MLFELKGKTLAGKNKVRNAMRLLTNNSWLILEQKDKVQFNQEKGPWVKIAPVCSDFNKAAELTRWVHLNDDKDLSLIPITE